MKEPTFPMAENTHPARRSILIWGGLVAAAVSIPTKAIASPLDQSVLSVTDAGLTSILVPESKELIQLPRDLGVNISGPLPSGTQISLRYDPRLYRTTETPQVVHGGIPIGITSVSSAEGVITITLTEAVSSGALSVIAGCLSQNRYPHDIVRNLKDVEVGRGGPAVRSNNKPDSLSKKKRPNFAGEPWGAECGALWEEIRWGHGNRYYRPLSASVLSVGPGPIPRGGKLRILCDPAIVANMSVLKATDAEGSKVLGKSTPIKDAETTGVEWTMTHALPAGARILLTITSTGITPANDLIGVKHPTIDFFGPADSVEKQRTTYRECIHRADVSVNSEMRKNSELASFGGDI